jgi:GNAT superfamily N-acetyltransferase
MPDISMREANQGDVATLSEIAIMAAHGIMALMYEALIPGKSVADLIIERRILNPRDVLALQHWRIAEDRDCRILGGLNSFPWNVDSYEGIDPAIGEDRLAPLAGLAELEGLATEMYFVNMVAVFPQHRRSGAGRALMAEAERLARETGFARVGLCTFDADVVSAAFYRKLGYVARERRPIRSHLALEFTGSWALMVRELRSPSVT